MINDLAGLLACAWLCLPSHPAIPGQWTEVLQSHLSYLPLQGTGGGATLTATGIAPDSHRSSLLTPRYGGTKIRAKLSDGAWISKEFIGLPGTAAIPFLAFS